MTDKFLTLSGIAELLGTSRDNARNTLASYGVYPIDYGIGRSRGYRWLQSAVQTAMRQMQADANAKGARTGKRQARPPKPKAPKMSLVNMSIDEIYNLTRVAPVQ